MVDDHVVERPCHNNRVPNSWSLEVSCVALFNWRLDGALRWKAEDRRLGTAGRVIWKVSTSKVESPVCVG
jgi:hypothetical protein